MEIKLHCSTCGAELKAEVYQFIDHIVRIRIELCDVCLMEMRQEGWDEGQEQGYSEGLIGRTL